jgi:hypothetical protein
MAAMTIVDLGAGLERTEVSFATSQPGASALVGYFTAGSRPRVVKVLKTPEVLTWAKANLSLSEPIYVQLIRRAPLRDNPFAPTRQMRGRVIAVNAVCAERLRGIDRELAAAALAPIVPMDTRERLLDRLFADRIEISLMPTVSDVVDVDFPETGPWRIPALVQEAIPGRRQYQFSWSGAGDVDGDRLWHPTFLLLLAFGLQLAAEEDLGLDLVPRPTRTALRFTNVLVRPGSANLVYIDFFGLSTPTGNAAERLGHRLGYGGRISIIRRFAERVVRRIAADVGSA